MSKWTYETYNDDPKPIVLECGSRACFDHSSGISYRCETFFAVVGSIGMPRHCKKLMDMARVVDKLKGKYENTYTQQRQLAL
jgi:hypothetical protein